MELKIIYMTNHDRRYAAMRKACGELQEEGRISDLCIPVLAERSSDWNASWERKFTGASLVMIHFMKNASKSPFWKACRSFLEAHGIPYFLDSVEGDAAEHSTAIETSVLHQFRLYFPERLALCHGPLRPRDGAAGSTEAFCLGRHLRPGAGRALHH